jgi:steroid delta-isomerase-like uncharacterized protein
MSLEKNLKVFEDLDEIVKKRDWEAFSAFHTKDVISYSPMRPEPTKGVEAHKEAIKGLFEAFPDMELKREKSFGEGDWVFASYTVTGTHKGNLPGPGGKTISPTNKRIEFPLGTTTRFENGKIAEEHNYFDRLTMLAQLGVNP